MIDDDPLHGHTADHHYWTTANAGEAAPGVQTPLSLTTWRAAGCRGLEESARAIGVLGPTEELPAPAVNGFHGRAVLSVDFLKVIGDRMPGADGPQVVSGLIGYVPDGMTFAPTRSYHLSVAKTFPRSFRRVPAALAELSAEYDVWWREAVLRIDELDEADVRTFLAEAVAHHERATVVQSVSTFTGVQPVHDALERVISRLGSDASSILTAPVGGAEMDVVADIWRASRGGLTVEDVVRRHGFHGPFEGELSAEVWRDDATPLQRMVQRYAARPDSDSPLAQHAERARARAEAERGLVASAPVLARPAVLGLLRLARRRLHLRGVAKRSMLQGFDGVRAGARRLGHILAADGRLDEPGDVFYLTNHEARAPLPADAKDLVAERRARRAQYQNLQLPLVFRGTPVPVESTGTGENRRTLEGVGVSAGVVEGTARVVTDPGFAEVEDGEVLIAPTTDPSWSSILFVSAALVVDIGGALSHAAVVARELEIPCVVNTRDGTSVIHTGDRVRVDGRAGTVEILERTRS
jgi:pyruvate,water dikinase